MVFRVTLTLPPAFTQPFVANTPQAFKLFYTSFPFLLNFPFGYTQPGVKWFSAEGIPVAPFDDQGRSNPFPLMRVQALAADGNSLGLTRGTLLSTLDTPTPVSGELNCKACHTSAQDGGNGLATDNLGIQVATRFDDPQFGQVPVEVSIEYAFDLNILCLHDKKHGTDLEHHPPVSCQVCHYSPALDLAHVGPKGPGNPDANGRGQTLHQSMSRVIHNFHAKLKNPGGTPMFPGMPSPVGRTTATRDAFLARTCYQCHPGQVTKCFRGVMFGAGAACQDCHGNLAQVGNDFSKNVSPATPGAFVLAADYYTNPATPRVPWANEPLCQSCHTGDVNSNRAGSSGAVRAPDGIWLLQAYRTTDPNAEPIVDTNRRFAENVISGKQVLYRLSKEHGGITCEACHGSLLQGSVLARLPVTRTLICDEGPNCRDARITLAAGTLIGCSLCHENPGRS